MALGISLWKFETSKHVAFTHSSGHRDFIKNMITDTPQADSVVPIFAADICKFKASVSKIVWIYQHALLAYMLGLNQLTVGVNTVDSTNPFYN